MALTYKNNSIFSLRQDLLTFLLLITTHIVPSIDRPIQCLSLPNARPRLFQSHGHSFLPILWSLITPCTATFRAILASRLSSKLNGMLRGTSLIANTAKFDQRRLVQSKVITTFSLRLCLQLHSSINTDLNTTNNTTILPQTHTEVPNDGSIAAAPTHETIPTVNGSRLRSTPCIRQLIYMALPRVIRCTGRICGIRLGNLMTERYSGSNQRCRRWMLERLLTRCAVETYMVLRARCHGPRLRHRCLIDRGPCPEIAVLPTIVTQDQADQSRKIGTLIPDTLRQSTMHEHPRITVAHWAQMLHSSYTRLRQRATIQMRGWRPAKIHGSSCSVAKGM